jgi:hypothetical protein
VITPDDRASWLRELAVLPEAPPAELREVVHLPDTPPARARLVYVADADRDPKLVYRVDEALWAVDRRQRCFTPAPPGTWAPLPAREPFRILPVPLEERLWASWENDDGRVLAVTTRGPGHRRPVTPEEWRKAAERLLPREEAQAFRSSIQPSFDHQRGGSEVTREQMIRKVDPAQLRTVEDWKRLLPDSYAAVERWNAEQYDKDVESRLRELRAQRGRPARVPDPAGLRAFVDGLELPVQTTFTLVDGAAVSSAIVPGVPPRELETQQWDGMTYRIQEGKLIAVMALEKTDRAGKAPPAFYEIEAPVAR